MIYLLLNPEEKHDLLDSLYVAKVLQVMNDMLIIASKPDLNYLLTYRMSQDHTELLFSKIGSMGGFK